MKIALIGATGYTGAAILKEALSRGHQVTGIVRHPEKLPDHPNLTPEETDVMDEEELARILAGHDAVVSAFSPDKSDPDLYDKHIRGARSIIRAFKNSGAARLLFVGGAGSLEVKPGLQLLDTPDFPEEWKATALATREVYNILEKDDFDWIFVCPAALLEPGQRTGGYRIDVGRLVTDEEGNSRISVEDYAVAMVDELEQNRYNRQKIGVGSM